MALYQWRLLPDVWEPFFGAGSRKILNSPVSHLLPLPDAARVRVVRPRLHLFGHIHADGGAWVDGATTYVNCTTWECERGPTVIDVRADRVDVVQAPPARR